MDMIDYIYAARPILNLNHCKRVLYNFKQRRLNEVKMAQNSEIDNVIAKCVDEIWSKYDTDGNGNLDKDETKQFVRDTLSDMSDGAGFNDEDFDQCFREFDKDGSGTIEKGEMVQFIKQVAGL